MKKNIIFVKLKIKIMEITGKIKSIGETQTFGSNGFRKRELVLTTEEQYPQDILIEFIQDNCQKVDNYKVNQDVTIAINLRGREWVNPQGETKYFNSIQGWFIKQAGASINESTESLNPEDHDDLDF